MTLKPQTMTFLLVLAAALIVGCAKNKGSNGRGAVYGPGSTGHIASIITQTPG
jgi:hypothetical protein